MALPRQALGKGLGALLPVPQYRNHGDDYFLCPVTKVDVDPDQPRERFEEGALEELVRSVREKGILQPIVVRRTAQPDHYMVIAGERRLRAARRVGLTDIPVLVKDVASDEAFELALIENIQRQDLNAIEEAKAYDRLLERPGMTQDALANRLGKSRSTIANSLRLLNLDGGLQQRVIEGHISAGHARSLLSVEDADARRLLAQRITDEGLSVRAAESAARELKGATPRTRTAASPSPLEPYYATLAEELSTALGTTVQIKQRGRKGQLTVQFQGVDELRRLRDRLI